MPEGYLGLFRLFFNSPEWNEKRKLSRAEAWLDLLQSAAFVPTERFVNGKLIHLKIGELIAAERFLEKRWGWSRTKVRNFIGLYEKNHELDHRKDQGETVRIIVNYKDRVYQATAKDTKGNTTNQTNGEPTENQRRTKCKKVKNDKQDKKVISKNRADSIEEVAEYCSSVGLPKSDAEYLWDHWEHETKWTNNGKPIKDWKATVRNWKRKLFLPSQKQQAASLKYAKPPVPDTGPPRPKKADLPEPEHDWNNLLPEHMRGRSWSYWCTNYPDEAKQLANGVEPFESASGEPVNFEAYLKGAHTGNAALDEC